MNQILPEKDIDKPQNTHKMNCERQTLKKRRQQEITDRENYIYINIYTEEQGYECLTPTHTHTNKNTDARKH